MNEEKKKKLCTWINKNKSKFIIAIVMCFIIASIVLYWQNYCNNEFVILFYFFYGLESIVMTVILYFIAGEVLSLMQYGNELFIYCLNEILKNVIPKKVITIWLVIVRTFTIIAKIITPTLIFILYCYNWEIKQSKTYGIPIQKGQLAIEIILSILIALIIFAIEGWGYNMILPVKWKDRDQRKSCNKLKESIIYLLVLISPILTVAFYVFIFLIIL